MLKKGKIYKLDETFDEKFGGEHGYIWVCEKAYRLNVREAFATASGFVSSHVRNRGWEVRGTTPRAARVYGGFGGKPHVTFIHDRWHGRFKSISTGYEFEAPDFVFMEAADA